MYQEDNYSKQVHSINLKDDMVLEIFQMEDIKNIHVRGEESEEQSGTQEQKLVRTGQEKMGSTPGPGHV